MSNAWIMVALFLAQAFLLADRSVVYGEELKTRYATIIYSNDELLNKFNQEIMLSRQLRLLLRNQKIFTLQDEVKSKVDLVVEKIESVLEMFPDVLQFNMDVLPTADDVQQVYLAKYGKRADHIAYYSLKEKTIYISADDANLRVMAHEIGHAVVDHYYKTPTPSKIHEVLAQYAEKHVDEDE